MIKEQKIMVVGPCAAESCEQVKDIMEAVSPILQKTPFRFFFRAGIWKPRSLPSTFQGVGEVGLHWLDDLQIRSCVPCLTEVISSDQLQIVLKSHLAGFWLGARTTANPVLVQSLADILAYHPGELPRYILIKNPISDDATLWLGAVERIETALNFYTHRLRPNEKVEERSTQSQNNISSFSEKAIPDEKTAKFHLNVTEGSLTHTQQSLKDHYDVADTNKGFTKPQIILVHRGCNHRPCFEMAYTLRRLRPQYPLLLDASHMSGDTSQIERLCLLGQYLGYDGWMLEVHNNPTRALSDAKQQISPNALVHLLLSLMQNPNSEDDDLRWLRSILDEIDDSFFLYLENRLRIVQKIGKYKQKKGLAIFQPQQYEKVRERFSKKAIEYGVSVDSLQAIYQKIHDMSVIMQNKI